MKIMKYIQYALIIILAAVPGMTAAEGRSDRTGLNDPFYGINSFDPSVRSINNYETNSKKPIEVWRSSGTNDALDHDLRPNEKFWSMDLDGVIFTGGPPPQA